MLALQMQKKSYYLKLLALILLLDLYSKSVITDKNMIPTIIQQTDQVAIG